jgi:predicted MPP superfamily phosphohydrolase
LSATFALTAQPKSKKMKKIFSLIFYSLLSISASAQMISGYVFVDTNNNGIKDKNEEGIKDVVVSDQVSTTVTGADGAYQFKAQGYGFVFISLPSGYKSLKGTWQKIDDKAKIDFPLAKTSLPQEFKFIHASDTHISEKSVDRIAKLRAIVDEVKPDFVIVSGDLVRDALRVSENEASGYYELYLKEIQKFPVPVWSIPGNHENFGIERHLSLVSPSHPLYGKKMYRHYLGPNYYSFNYGGVHFIGLDDVDFEDLWYYGHVDSLQVAWMKRDLSTVGNAPVITFNHIPFFTGGLSLTMFTETGLSRTLEREKGVLQFRHTVSNAHELVSILSQYNYPVALSGHLHARQVFWYESEGQKTRYEQASAVVGPSDEGGIKIPSGVTLYVVKDGKISEGQFIPLDKK